MGLNKSSLKKVSFAVLTSKLLEGKYELGVLDCFMVIYKYLKEVMPDLPTSFDNISIDQYGELFLSDKKKAKELMIRAVENYLEEVLPNQTVAGDILLAQYKGQLPFLAIDAGNGNLMAASPGAGVSVVSKKYYHVMRAFKCHKRSL